MIWDFLCQTQLGFSAIARSVMISAAENARNAMNHLRFSAIARSVMISAVVVRIRRFNLSSVSVL